MIRENLQSAIEKLHELQMKIGRIVVINIQISKLLDEVLHNWILIEAILRRDALSFQMTWDELDANVELNDRQDISLHTTNGYLHCNNVHNGNQYRGSRCKLVLEQDYGYTMGVRTPWTSTLADRGKQLGPSVLLEEDDLPIDSSKQSSLKFRVGSNSDVSPGAVVNVKPESCYTQLWLGADTYRGGFVHACIKANDKFSPYEWNVQNTNSDQISVAERSTYDRPLIGSNYSLKDLSYVDPRFVVGFGYVYHRSTSQLGIGMFVLPMSGVKYSNATPRAKKYLLTCEELDKLLRRIVYVDASDQIRIYSGKILNIASFHIAVKQNLKSYPLLASISAARSKGGVICWGINDTAYHENFIRECVPKSILLE